MICYYLNVHFQDQRVKVISHQSKGRGVFLIQSFRRVLNVVSFLLSNSLLSEFYMPKYRNTLFHLHRQVGAPTYLRRWKRESVPKRRHIKFRHRGITQKKTYDIEFVFSFHFDIHNFETHSTA